MLRTAGTCCLLVALLAAVGCVERTITIRSEPSGAVAYLNDEEVGRTPVTVPFKFYGEYSVRLEKDGYRTLTTSTEAEPPFWELPGPDLVAELMPGDRRVDLGWDYELKKHKPADPDRLIDRAKQLRATFEAPGPEKVKD